MHLQLRRVSASYDAGRYAAAVGCALTLDRVDELVNRVHMNFAEALELLQCGTGISVVVAAGVALCLQAIKLCTKDVLHSHVVLSLGGDGAVSGPQLRALELGKYKDVCGQLREARWLHTKDAPRAASKKSASGSKSGESRTTSTRASRTTSRPSSASCTHTTGCCATWLQPRRRRAPRRTRRARARSHARRSPTPAGRRTLSAVLAPLL